MDPGAFNLNRLGNAYKAEEEWKQRKRKGPPSPWGPVILFLIMIVLLVLWLRHII